MAPSVRFSFWCTLLFCLFQTSCGYLDLDLSELIGIDVTISSPLGQKTSATTIPIVVEFSSDVESLSASEIVVTNGTIGAITKVNNRKYTFDLTPGAEGVVRVEVNGESILDGLSSYGTSAFEMLYGDPPTFSGAKYSSRISDSEVLLSWDAATDNVTPSDQLTYEVCVATNSTDCVNNFSVTQTVTGLTSLFLSALTGVEYHFLVRVKDALGFNDTNVVTTPNKKLSATAIGGNSYTHCALLSDATVKCWGQNKYGALGLDPTITPVSGKPVAIAGLTNVASIGWGTSYDGPHHICFVITGGTIKCLGLNANGQLGGGSASPYETTPVTVAGLGGTATQVTMGASHTCALLTDQTVRCWGSGLNGELGNSVSANSLTPVTVTGINTAIHIAASYYYTCAILADGTGRCWGLNTNGKLGNNSTVATNSPVVVSGLTNAIKIAASSYSTCALLSTGQVKCWGTGDYGAMGNGTWTSSNPVPVTVSGINNAIDLSGGGWADKYCATLSDNTVKCWGKNFDGDLGLGHLRNINTPEVPIGLTGVATTAIGYASSCALLTNQTIRCWGSGFYGLGTGDAKAISHAVVVPGLTDVEDLASGHFNTCAIKSNQSVQCWGSNDGQFANLGSTTSQIMSTPTTFAGLTTVTQMDLGLAHGCAILADKTMRCWGQGDSGELGHGAYANSTTPVVVTGINTAAKVVSGRNWNCALLDNGDVKCWGGNPHKWGNGVNTWYNVPTAIPGLTNMIDIDGMAPQYWPGYDTICGLKNDGTIWCWGQNDVGQLGDGSFINRSAVVQVSGINNAVKLAIDGGTSCALLADSTVKCWGWGNTLGNGTSANSSTPVVVTGLTGVTQIDAAGGHVCAVITGGTVKCWGGNWWGQMANVALPTQLSPVTISLTKPVSKITAANTHVCALHTDKTVSCWGYYGSGNMGNGIQTMTPVAVAIE
jgi:alpha-tubulin suppressor-like RCC1 family protein